MLGEKIKLYRENKKMTQNEVAEALGVKAATISKYEAGTLEPNIESLKKLADLFEVSVDELIKEDTFDISKINILEVLREQKNMKLKGNLYHNTQITFAYNTNHIEGSKLTEDQTRYIYETNTLLAEKDSVTDLDDVLETANHFKLVDYMLEIADKKLTEKMVKEFHKILKEGTSDSRKNWFIVGDYKKLPNEVGGLKTTEPKNVEKDMKKLLEWYGELNKITINEIIEFHSKFEKIHPFQDGNGRVGRIIAFKECLKNNIVPFIILDKEKLFYYRGLNQYQTNKEKGYLIDTCLNAQDQYTEMLKIQVSNEDPVIAANVANALAEVFKSKVKEIYNIENVTVIDKGIPSSSPYNVNYMKNVAIFGMIGMIASCGILFILFYFDTRIKSKSEVEELLGLEVLGVIPEIKA